MQDLNERGVVHLRRLKIKNIRCFERFEFKLRVPRSDRGQWTLILGDNGCGKSTLLRSIVLGLIRMKQGNSVLDARGVRAPHVRTGANDGEICVRWRTLGEQDRNRTVSLYPLGDGTDGFQPPHVEPGELPFVWAYGAQRGSALGGVSRSVDIHSSTGGFATLFSGVDGELIHASTWLQQLRLASYEAEDGNGLYEAVRKTIIQLLPGITDMGVTSEEVWLEGPALGRAPLDAYSDGYLTTAGWILDMIARWVEHERRNGRTPTGDFREQMTGLVLIDELDLHLHPRWQLRVVQDLRDWFPRLSFIASTHNPLTLHGAKKGEIQVLTRDLESNTVSAAQIDIPPGSRVDNILTGAWFGLPSTLDPQTRELLEQHSAMFRQGEGDSEVARKLEEEIRNRIGRYADTSVERMAVGIAAEMRAERQNLSDEARRRIREDILSRVDGDSD